MIMNCIRNKFITKVKNIYLLDKDNKTLNFLMYKKVLDMKKILMKIQQDQNS